MDQFLTHDLIVNSPLLLLNISMQISQKNLVTDQDNNLYLTSLSKIIICLQDNELIS